MKPAARRILNGLALFALFLFLAVAQSGAQAPPKDDVTLTILHTNDLHGHILPFAYVENGRSTEEMRDVGGAARRATAIRQIKSGSDHPVLVVDAGDTFTRGPFHEPLRRDF
jgi:5'-nucleotidase